MKNIFLFFGILFSLTAWSDSQICSGDYSHFPCNAEPVGAECTTMYPDGYVYTGTCQVLGQLHSEPSCRCVSEDARKQSRQGNLDIQQFAN